MSEVTELDKNDSNRYSWIYALPLIPTEDV